MSAASGPVPPLTEERVREIIREELARARKGRVATLADLRARGALRKASGDAS